MSKWIVVLQHTGYREFEVEALDQGEAEGKAFELAEEPAPWDTTPEIIVWSAEEITDER
jgi:hypothetical protein